jgi:hypothetical protein
MGRGTEPAVIPTSFYVWPAAALHLDNLKTLSWVAHANPTLYMKFF